MSPEQLDAVRQMIDRYKSGRRIRRHDRTMFTSYHHAARRLGAKGSDDARAVERILSSVIDPDTGCWEWQGAKTIGYGRIRSNGRVDMAHRVSYRLFVGPLRGGFCVDHQCANKGCVNPEHLEQVTYSVNMRRAHLVRDAIAALAVIEEFESTGSAA